MIRESSDHEPRPNRSRRPDGDVGGGVGGGWFTRVLRTGVGAVSLTADQTSGALVTTVVESHGPANRGAVGADDLDGLAFALFVSDVCALEEYSFSTHSNSQTVARPSLTKVTSSTRESFGGRARVLLDVGQAVELGKHQVDGGRGGAGCHRVDRVVGPRHATYPRC